MTENIPQSGCPFLTRREWLNRVSNGFGAVALSALMQEQEARAQSAGNPLASKTPPIPTQAKAKRVIHIFMEGAMPHQDNWDPKPELIKKGKRGSNPGTKAGNKGAEAALGALEMVNVIDAVEKL